MSRFGLDFALDTLGVVVDAIRTLCNLSLYSDGTEVEFVRRAPLNMSFDYLYNEKEVDWLNNDWEAELDIKTFLDVETNNYYFNGANDGTVAQVIFVYRGLSDNFRIILSDTLGSNVYSKLSSFDPKDYDKIFITCINKTIRVYFDGVIDDNMTESFTSTGDIITNKNYVGSRFTTGDNIEGLFYGFRHSLLDTWDFISNAGDGKYFIGSEHGEVLELFDPDETAQYPNYTPTDPNDIVRSYATGNLNFDGTTQVVATTPHNSIDYGVDGVSEVLNFVSEPDRSNVVDILTISNSTLAGQIQFEQRDNDFTLVRISGNDGVQKGFVLMASPANGYCCLGVTSRIIDATTIAFDICRNGVLQGSITGDRAAGYVFDQSELATVESGGSRFGGEVVANFTKDSSGNDLKRYVYDTRLKGQTDDSLEMIDTVIGGINTVNKIDSIYPYYTDTGAYLVEDRYQIGDQCVTVPAGQEIVTELTVPVTESGSVVIN